MMNYLIPGRHEGTKRSISDDDRCADCHHCQYFPGRLSTCALGWPGQPNPDGYIVQCARYQLTVLAN